MFLIHVLKLLPIVPYYWNYYHFFALPKSPYLSLQFVVSLYLFWFSPSLFCRMDILHQLCGILLSTCQQLRCLVCCAPVSGRSVQISPTVSLHFHFLALSLACAHTTWLHLKICIFYTLPNEQLHQLCHVAIGVTAFVQAFYILQPYD